MVIPSPEMKQNDGKRHFSINVDADIYAWLRQYAGEEERSISNLVNRFLRAEMNKYRGNDDDGNDHGERH